jgi:hypothetical protein
LLINRLVVDVTFFIFSSLFSFVAVIIEQSILSFLRRYSFLSIIFEPCAPTQRREREKKLKTKGLMRKILTPIQRRRIRKNGKNSRQ